MVLVRDDVFSYDDSQEIGATVEECTNAMAAQGGTSAKVRQAIDILVEQGHLYCTIDDDHYKSTS